MTSRNTTIPRAERRKGASPFALAMMAPLVLAAPAIANAQDTGTPQAAPGDIVVTAQFREQQLQDTPLSITAVSGDMLEARSLTNITQVAASAPNVTLRRGNSAFGGGTMQAFIRGVGQGDHSFASEPGVGVYVDDVYHATLFGSVFDLLDLERIEVLRGPQGTLFGKNSIGGAIRLISKKADGGGDGLVEITTGSNNRFDVRGSFDTTILDDVLFLRVAGASKSNDGYQEVTDFACENPGLAGTLPSELPSGSIGCSLGKYGGEDVKAARANLRWVPTDTFEVNIIADILKDSSPAPADTQLVIDPAAGAISNWNDNINIPRYGIPLDGRFVTGDPFKTYATYADPFTGEQFPRNISVDEWGLSAVVDWQINPSLALKYIAAYRTFTGGFSHDSDGSPMAFQMIYNDLEHRQQTHEVRLSGQALSERLNYTLGAFYYKGEEEEHNTVHIYGFDLSGPGGPYIPLVFESNDEYENTNKSAFIHAEFAVTDKLNVLGGYRYTDESKDLLVRRFFFGDPPETASTRSDWRVGADYHFTDDLMVYGNVATGYRSGGFNPRPFAASDLVSYGPEEVTQYEAGFKSDWFDKRLRFNATYYYSEYEGLVVPVLRANLLGLPSTVPTNAASATIQGIELELEARPIDGMLINLTYGTTKNDRAATPTANPPLPARTDPGPVPEDSVAIGAEYAFNLGGYGTLTPRVDWRWQSLVNFDTGIIPDPIAAQDSYSVGDFRVTWDHPEGEWSASFGVTNFTDELYYINKFSLLAAGFGTVEGQPGAPRQWLASVKRRF